MLDLDTHLDDKSRSRGESSVDAIPTRVIQASSVQELG